MFYFYTPSKSQQIGGFLMYKLEVFLGGTKVENWLKMG